VNRIDHTSHNHPATPAARKACRKATCAGEAAKAERVEREARFDADMARVDAAQPFAKRAIVVNVTMASGKRCSVTFDRYGMNSELYRTALAYGWSAERTVAQAISEALAGALRSYPGDTTTDYRLVEVD
jgi:hypothetical protein